MQEASGLLLVLLEPCEQGLAGCEVSAKQLSHSFTPDNSQIPANLPGNHESPSKVSQEAEPGKS